MLLRGLVYLMHRRKTLNSFVVTVFSPRLFASFCLLAKVFSRSLGNLTGKLTEDP